MKYKNAFYSMRRSKFSIFHSSGLRVSTAYQNFCFLYFSGINTLFINSIIRIIVFIIRSINININIIRIIISNFTAIIVTSSASLFQARLLQFGNQPADLRPLFKVLLIICVIIFS